MQVPPASTSLVIMARAPRAGHTKTRLMPALTADEAAGLYQAMLLDTIERLGFLSELELWLAFTPEDERGWFETNIDSEVQLMAQRGDDLGQRMHHIVEDRRSGGAEAVLIVGTDLPTLPEEYVLQAADLLGEDNGVVLGPTEDGGYYLIGLREPDIRLFERIDWSTASVFQQTLRQAEAAGKFVSRVPSCFDIDEPADLERLRSELQHSDEQSHPPHTANFLARLGSGVE